MTLFAKSDLMKCPNGLTVDSDGNLYTCNFSDGLIIKMDQSGNVSKFAHLPELKGGPSLVGNGHLTYKDGALYVVTIGRGELFRITMDGKTTLLAGQAYNFKTTFGALKQASFNRPNGIAMSATGDTIFINVSTPTWLQQPQRLDPSHLIMISGMNSQK